jgi:large subunit ribosomal protein L4
MKVSVLNIKGKETGRSVELSKKVFEINPSDHAVYLDVKQYLANQRQGNAKTKERAEIKGSTRKIKKQKGTGTARAGSIKNPLFRGGGTIFGPRPRDYELKVNKSVKKLARKSALTDKCKTKSISVVENIDFKTPKTKSFNDLLKAFGLEGKKTLFVMDGVNKNVYLSARNLNKSEVVTDSEISTYKIINAQHLVIEENAVEKIQSNLI